MPAKKYLILSVLCLLVAITNKAKAQYYNNDAYREDTWHVSIGADGFYRQNPPHQYGTGYGAELGLEYYPNNYVALTATTGYYSLTGKTVQSIKVPNFSYIPIKLGFKGFVFPKWYVFGEAGLGYSNNPIGADKSHIAKIIAPSIGYNDPDYGIDISFRYFNIANKANYISMVGFQIAYSFDLSGGGY